MQDLNEFLAEADQATQIAIEACTVRGTGFPYSDYMRTHWKLLTAQCFLTPLMVEKDDDGGWMFQLHPDPAQASSKAWGWLWPVVKGHRTYMFQTYHGSPGHWFWQEYYDKCEARPGYEAMMECLCGEDFVDIAAFSLDFSKCYGRLHEVAPVMGHPLFPECARDKPVRLFRTVKRWLEGKCGGAVLIGRDWENEIWLRGCENGIITDDVAHGKAIKKILSRPYEGPEILVAT